jgi:hypothetical protein
MELWCVLTVPKLINWFLSRFGILKCIEENISYNKQLGKRNSLSQCRLHQTPRNKCSFGESRVEMLIYIPITQVAHNKSRSKEAPKNVPDLAHLHAPKKEFTWTSDLLRKLEKISGLAAKVMEAAPAVDNGEALLRLLHRACHRRSSRGSGVMPAACPRSTSPRPRQSGHRCSAAPPQCCHRPTPSSDSPCTGKSIPFPAGSW